MTGEGDKRSRTTGRNRPGFRQTRALGKVLREAREAVPLTREQVRAETGFSVTTLYWAESGERLHDDGKTKPYAVSTSTLVRLARLYGMTPQQLAKCKRPEAAALVRAPVLPGDLTDDDKSRIADALLTLRHAVPDFASMVGWIGVATGDLDPADVPPDAD